MKEKIQDIIIFACLIGLIIFGIYGCSMRYQTIATLLSNNGIDPINAIWFH